MTILVERFSKGRARRTACASLLLPTIMIRLRRAELIATVVGCKTRGMWVRVLLALLFSLGLMICEGRAFAQSRGHVFVTSCGERGQGRFKEIDAEGRIVLEVGGHTRVFSAGELVRWGQWRERGQGVAVLLSDRSLLRVEDLRLVDDGIEIPESPTSIWQQARWSREVVKAIVYQWPAAALDRDRLAARLWAAPARREEVWLEGGDRIEGVLRIEEAAEADVSNGETREERWIVRTRAGDVPIARERVVAVSLPTAVDANPPTQSTMWLALRDGSSIHVRALARREDRVEVTLVSGATLTASAEELWRELRGIQPLTDRMRYVSDLTPVGYKHVPYLSQAWDWRRDQSVVGGFLRTGDVLYRKGLGMHSSARLAYDVPEACEWFCAELAIDERAGQRGSVVFRVYADGGDGQWRGVFESQVVRGGETPIPVRLDIRGVKRLALIVDFADQGDELDYADWLDARLVRSAN